ncbi:ribosomal protein L19 (chloroplast) [Porphyra umbilicalis]|uniref:Ribosomal protein L19 n=1 Tax=Porphyra umbilicalis TaxID=2786 RepID=J7F9L3_PORUM|nr:ribosomal protein L19 [Porphyra umbilicalis]AFC39999.1 ribosomal protein L19 [Porphyra umbilicalis]ASN78803.1 ribosomal protein L19 [Porphyra umbilicalis]|eukprot:ASN78803.1 ribosomal protein L19 (chloroplast) [Porphyra umbilicalis]
MKDNNIKLSLLMKSIERPLMKAELPEIKVGDTIRLGLLVKEGSKTREQLCEGVVLSRKKRKSLNNSLTLRCSFQGIGVERVFFLNSPRVTFAKVIRRAKVRRAKLYYLRNLLGKASRLKQIFD